MNATNKKLKVIDLFAGAGGFSCGLMKTDAFDIVLAVEVHPQYRETYKRNHQGVRMLGDINRIIGSPRFDSLAGALRRRHGRIDVVVGGPPCQGFSKANRQRNHLISTNNLLVTSYMKFVDKLEPRAFVMENVRDMPKYGFYVSTDPWDESALKLSGVDLEVEIVTLGSAGGAGNQLAEFLQGYLHQNSVQELPCSRLMSSIYPPLRTLRNYVQRHRKMEAERFIEANRPFFRRTCQAVAETSTLPDFIKDPLITLLETLSQSLSVENALESLLAGVTEQLVVLTKFDELHRNRVKVLALERREGRIVVHLQSYNLAEHFVRYFEKRGYRVDFDVLEATKFGVPQRRERVIFLGVRAEELGDQELEFPQPLISNESCYYTVEDAIADLEGIDPVIDAASGPILRSLDPDAPPLARYLREDNRELHNHLRTQTREAAQMRYDVLRQGQNFHDLPSELIGTYSDPSRTQRNIYLRLDYNAPAPTVTNVRKAMWVHPTVNRAISVREAARLQSFPDWYKFYGVKNAQYQQVGNAVPPMLAQAVGEVVARMLKVTPVRTLQETLKDYPRKRHLGNGQR